jgi:hypothetical protein
MRTGKQRRRNPEAKLTNPFIAALLRFRQQRPVPEPPPMRPRRSGLVPIPLGYEPSDPLSRLPPYPCDEELVYDVAVPVLQALLTGDLRILKTLKEAIKETHHIYGRDRDQVLLRQALEYRLWEGRGLGVEEFKRGLEARVNHGKPLPQHRWNHVRKAVELKKLKTGTAASNYNWESRREKLEEKRRDKRRKSDTE